MKTSWRYRFIFFLFVSIFAVVMIVPTFFNVTRYPVKSKINLGLDLKGGVYILLGIDFSRVFQDELTSFARQVVDFLKESNIEAVIGEVDASVPDDPQIGITISGDTARARELIREGFSQALRLTSADGDTLRYATLPSYRNFTRDTSVGKSIEVIRNRIDQFGIAEPEIFSQGIDRIVVQLPGIDDVERAKELIGRTAKLEFKIVSSEVSSLKLNELVEKAKTNGITYKVSENFTNYLAELNTFLKADIPAGYEIVFQRSTTGRLSENSEMIPYLVEIDSNLTGDDLETASVQTNPQTNMPIVSLRFKPNGAVKFENITGNNIGKSMAIVLDGNVYSAPTIQQKIPGGNAQITLGAGSLQKITQEANDLAVVLRAGALPVSLDFLEQRIVGPTLGMDSINKTVKASIIGFICILIFAIIYYKSAGVISVIILLLNVVLTLAILVLFGATLTLPGIAGIALTIGMAIDSNIIIYERIREEILRGVSNYQATETGFDFAFWTILDANITTAMAGMCLLNFGSGPIRGFAVTLLIGIFSTVYTTYFGSKVLFDLYLYSSKGQRLSI